MPHAAMAVLCAATEDCACAQTHTAFLCVQGGIIVVGPDGKVVYTYLEKSGSPLPLEEIRTAILSFGGACKALPEPVKA